ncbi:MAG: hypothetical protein EKK31_05935 [Hyphomicrobiales bacterium]|nr:MAG: hypothetical protein EKK31_05935 [Hyphomicrobiales bacterium]
MIHETGFALPHDDFRHIGIAARPPGASFVQLVSLDAARRGFDILQLDRRLAFRALRLFRGDGADKRKRDQDRPPNPHIDPQAVCPNGRAAAQ